MRGWVLVSYGIMDKAIERHLAMRGVRPTPPQLATEDEMRRNADFFSWFEECVMGFDSDEYRREFWREARKTGHTIGHVPYGLKEYRKGSPVQIPGSILFFFAAMACSLPFWFIRRAIDRHLARLRRPTYYEVERQRRHELAEERRRVRRRRTISPMPSMNDIREALARVSGSPADMIRLGSLVEDLECYVDNSIYFNEKGEVAGRRGGIRRHLQNHAPDLYARYKTLMRYKSLARKFRQAAGESDPVPAALLLPREFNSDEVANNGVGEVFRERRAAVGCSKGQADGLREFNSDGNPARGGACEEGKRVGETMGLKATTRAVGEARIGEIQGKPPPARWPEAMVKPRAEAVRVARELLACCEASCVSLAAQLALRLSPDYTPIIDPEILRHGNGSTMIAADDRQHGRSAAGVA